VPRNDALGAFLRDRRGRVNPSRAGLPVGRRRRVSGLRREEVARLADLSVDYYARLEQGRQHTASPAVLRSVARALFLTEDERRHLFTLAGVPDEAVSAASAEPADDRIGGLLSVLGDTPAMVVGPFVDVVQVNPAAAFLFDDFAARPEVERNGLRWMLLDPRARALYGDAWEGAAGEMVGMVRLDAGHDPRNPRLAELVAELTEHSELFRRLWADQTVSTWQHHRKTLRHPELDGPMDFTNEFLSVHGAPNRTVAVMIPADPQRFRAALNRHS